MFEIGTADSILQTPVFQINTQRKGVNPFAPVDEMSNMGQSEGIESPFNKPEDLMEAFEMDDVKNRFKILNVFPREQQNELIELLSDEALVLGMKLYEKDKIMNLLFETTQNDISKVLTKAMPEEKIFELIPEKFLNKFLLNKDLEKKDIIKGLEKFEPSQLQKLMESLMGIPQKGKTPEEMIKVIEKIPMEKLQPMLLTIEPEQKSNLIAKMTKENDELYDLFPKSHLLIPLEENNKDMTIKGLNGLEPEMLQGMLTQLPDELMPILLTLIEPEVLAEALIEEYPEVIIQILSGNANK